MAKRVIDEACTLDVKVSLDRSIQQSAEDTARAIRGLLAAKKILAVNLISSPGSGKTTLIEKMIGTFGEKGRIAVVPGRAGLVRRP